MPLPAYTPVTEGGTMDWLTLMGNIQGVRDYLNAVPTDDITNGSVQATHIVRPRISGFPNNEFRGQREIVKWCTYGLDTNSAATPEQSARRQRLTIVPYAVSNCAVVGSTTVHRLPLGFSVYLPASAAVEVQMTWEWHIRALQQGSDPAAVNVSYPQSADGAVNVAGWFTLFRRRRSTTVGVHEDAEDAGDAHWNMVYPLDGKPSPGTTSGQRYNQHGAIDFRDTLGVGWWDFGLVYVAAPNRVEGLLQIDVSWFSGKLEAHM